MPASPWRGAPPPSVLGSLIRGFGRALVKGMPAFLKLLGIVGTAAMIWVGGGILVHGLETYGMPWLGHAIHDAGAWAAGALSPAGGIVAWLVTAAGSGLVGLVVGGLLIPVTSHLLVPAWKGVSQLREKAA